MSNLEQSLRPYQVEAIDKIRESFATHGKKVLLWLATGGGKTTIFSKIMKEAAKNGKKTIMVVRGRKLVDQASQRLTRESVEHGILMAGHWNYRPHLPVQVCSIDTVISRNLRPEADVIVVDEAHMAASTGFKDFLKLYPSAFIVAVTATPYVQKGLRHLADNIVKPITMQGLIDLGYLVPFRFFAPTTPDLRDVQISRSTHDYVPGQLEGAMIKGHLTGKIIDHWKKIAENRSTICFAVSIKHSRMLVERFKAAGIEAEHCDADTKDDERNEIIQRLEKGITKVVCNVGIFCTGVDIPSLGAIIMARPTQSRNLFIQQAGRGTRPFEGKADCIVLDHAGNVGRHQLPTDEIEVDLDGKEKASHQKLSKTCKHCFAIYRGPKCPECDTEQEEGPAILPEESDDKLVELKDVDWVKRSLIDFQNQARITGKKIQWAYYKLVEKYGVEKAKPYVPAYIIQNVTGRQTNKLFAYSPYQGIDGR